MSHDHKVLPLSSRARGITLGAVRILNLGFGVVHRLCLNACMQGHLALSVSQMCGRDSLCNVRIVLSADLSGLSLPSWANILEVLGQRVAVLVL